MPPEPKPSDALDPSVVVGLLAEPGRLRAVAALALGAATLPEVAAAAHESVANGSSRYGDGYDCAAGCTM